MKVIPAFRQRRGEGGALGEEAVAGMHRLGTGRLAGVDDAGDVEVGLRGRRRSDLDRLVGHRDMQRGAVGLGVHGDRGDPHPPRGLDHPAGNLAAIGDQDLLEHGHPFRAVC